LELTPGDSPESLAEQTAPDTPRRLAAAWRLIGVMLMAVFAVLTVQSPRLAYGTDMLVRPIREHVALLVLAGGLFFAAALIARKASAGRALLLWAFVVGLLLRGITFFSGPVLEDDYYRYLWDGGVAAHGINPYRYAPRDVAESADHVPAELRSLAVESGDVLQRVNHPGLRTIYPPVAQAAFAVAHWISPWGIRGLRLVFFLFDLATLLLVLAFLRRLNLPALWVILYWWNPLVIHETFNTTHVDVVALPLVLGALLFATRRKYTLATAALALAVGAKLWPVVLLPFILRPILRRPKKVLAALAVFVLLAALMAVPIFSAGMGENSGFRAYGSRWQMNDSAFMLLLWGVEFAFKRLAFDAGMAGVATRLLAASLVAAWTLWLVRRPIRDDADLCRRCLYTIAAVFLLSPTQFPWYYLWLVPLLALRPMPSLLLLTPLLPVYYLRFYIKAHHDVALFDHYIVWVEYVPVWCLLIREWLSIRAGRDPWQRRTRFA